MSLQAKSDRIIFLDGLRGLAIAMVVVYHVYAGYTDIYPYGAKYNFFLIRQGWLGVELFFMISGFVILLTLEKCENLIDFMIRRWLRLFPAMLICSFFITALGIMAPIIFDSSPSGQIQIKNIFPGLLFIDGDTLSAMLGVTVIPLETSFWTLFVEVKFYAVFGILFFLLGERAAVVFISALPFLVLVFRLSGWETLSAVMDRIGFSFFGWFAVGALSYWLFKGAKSVALVLLLTILSIANAYLNHRGILSIPLGLFLSALFVSLAAFPPLRYCVSGRLLVFIGFISYPLYLLHENIVVALVIKSAQVLPALPGFLLPLAPLVIIIALSYLVAQYGENALRRRLRSFARRLGVALSGRSQPDRAVPLDEALQQAIASGSTPAGAARNS